MILFFLFPLIKSQHFTTGDPTKITCRGYQCNKTPGKYCLGTGINNYYASACPKSTFCSSQGICINTKNKYQNTEAYPGEVCNNEILCKFGTCVKGFCKGKEFGEVCNEILECDPGLRCHHTCKKLFLNKERGCLTDFDCQPDSACNYGECTKYFSLKTSRKVEKCEKFSNFLCESAACDKGKCLDFQVSDEFPKECESDKDCVSTDGHFVQCMCGFNENAKSFCLPFSGDSVGKEYFSVLLK